jgi:hypothetical protein
MDLKSKYETSLLIITLNLHLCMSLSNWNHPNVDICLRSTQICPFPYPYQNISVTRDVFVVELSEDGPNNGPKYVEAITQSQFD